MEIKDQAEIVQDMVTMFVTTKRDQLWYAFADNLRNALIDACVMDHILLATDSPQEVTFRAAQLLDLRRAFVRALHAGIPRRGDSPLRYMLEVNAIGGAP